MHNETQRGMLSYCGYRIGHFVNKSLDAVHHPLCFYLSPLPVLQ